jgi:hypothetical protein
MPGQRKTSLTSDMRKPAHSKRICAIKVRIFRSWLQALNDMRTITILGLLILFGCSGQSSSVNKDFAELRDKLPTIETPISFNSNSHIGLGPADLADNGLLKELKERSYFSVFGKIFESEDFITIIGYIPNDTGTPLLITFDKTGTQTSSYAAYETAMGDMGRYTSNFVTIDRDRTIHFIDSTVTRKINEDGTDEIPGTDSLIVTTRKYRLADKGTIESVD